MTESKSGSVTASVFVGISLDGFLARPDGNIDWLTGGDNGGGDGAEYGYDEFIKDIDVIVMGRKSFEKVLTFEKWFYGDKRVAVLSSRPLDLARAKAWGARVEQMSGTPEEIVAKLAAQGAFRLYVDGGETIRRFLGAGLIQRVILSRLPVLIGQGIPLFGPLEKDIRLKHEKTKVYDGGMVQSTYTVSR
jgi:dihydrofolate reductase